MIEVWKDIQGYEGLYQVSNFGNVRGLDRVIYGNGSYKNGRFVKGGLLKQRNGEYLRVNLNKDGVKKTERIHVLVANAFLPNPFNYSEINHIDGNKHNNNLSNLEWCSRSYNAKHYWNLKKIVA